MIDFTGKEQYDFSDLFRLVELLRGPGGCPWDAAQTHLSIRRNLLEEAYELCEGFDRDDPDSICEELGDVLLQVLFHTDIERRAGRFTLDDVCDRECKKLIFRHPFLFGGEQTSWDEIKKKEKGQTTTAEAMRGVAGSLPATWRCDKLLKKAEGSGLSVASAADPLGKLEAAANALRVQSQAGQDASEAAGALLFAAVQSVCALGLDPETVLHSACDAFIQDFAAAEQAESDRER